MPKFEKENNLKLKSQKSQEFNQNLAYKSLIYTFFLGIIFFIVSILFNVADILALLALDQGLLLEIAHPGMIEKYRLRHFQKCFDILRYPND